MVSADTVVLATGNETERLARTSRAYDSSHSCKVIEGEFYFAHSRTVSALLWSNVLAVRTLNLLSSCLPTRMQNQLQEHGDGRRDRRVLNFDDSGGLWDLKRTTE